MEPPYCYRFKLQIIFLTLIVPITTAAFHSDFLKSFFKEDSHMTCQDLFSLENEKKKKKKKNRMLSATFFFFWLNFK